MNRTLREKATYLQQMEENFLKLGGPNWKKSKFYPVISSLRFSRSEVKEQLSQSLSLTNSFACYGSAMNKNQRVFEKSETVLLTKQENCLTLNPNYRSDDCRFEKKHRSDLWFEIRKNARVTGSSMNQAIGLGKLRQQEHYDAVFHNKPKPDYNSDVRERMQYGTIHEIDAIATLTAKVLPFLFPDLSYFEEGCQKVPYLDIDSFMIVSPDGSLKDNITGDTRFMYENKCKSPNSFSPDPYYVIPDYYVLQILSEMKAYSCNDLIFTC